MNKIFEDKTVNDLIPIKRKKIVGVDVSQHLKIGRMSLGHIKAWHLHEDLANIQDGYSLTLTINPYYNVNSMDTQYNLLLKDITAFMKELGPFYRKAMITPEYTKDYNCHFHIYFKSDKTMLNIDQQIKYLKHKYKHIGKNYKLKKIDEVSDELKKYPFKDIDKTKHYAEACENRMEPKHYYFEILGNIIIEK